MEKEQFLKLMGNIIYAENRQSYKARFIQTCLDSEVRSMRKIANAIGVTITDDDILVIIPELTKGTLEEFTRRAKRR